jgi:hypothetical protein
LNFLSLEVTHVSYRFESLQAAAAVRDLVLELVKAGGIFHLADCDGIEPIPFHAETVAAVAVRA